MANSPTDLINQKFADLTDWRGPVCAQIRASILACNPKPAEDWKWDTAFWTSNGLVCAVATFKDKIKVNFFRGASVADPYHLFNAGLTAQKTRAIDIYKDDLFDEAQFAQLVQAAVSLNNV